MRIVILHLNKQKDMHLFFFKKSLEMGSPWVPYHSYKSSCFCYCYGARMPYFIEFYSKIINIIPYIKEVWHTGIQSEWVEGIKLYNLWHSEDSLFSLVLYSQAVVDKGRNVVYIAKHDDMLVSNIMIVEKNKILRQNPHHSLSQKSSLSAILIVLRTYC